MIAQLDTVACDRTTRVGQTKRRASADCCKNTGRTAAQDASNEMCVEDAQNIIHVSHELYLLSKNVHAQPRDTTGAQTDQEGGPASNHARSWGDGHKTTDHTVDGANDGGFAEVGVVEEGPRQHARCSADVCIQNGHTGIDAGSIRITTVEAVPAEPKDACTDKNTENVVRPSVLAIGRNARTDPPSANEASCPAGQMNNITSRVIDDTKDREEAAAPNGICDHRV